MASTRWSFDGKRVLNSGGWSGWQGMSGTDYIHNRPSISAHEVIYRSASAGSGYFTAADCTVCVYYTTSEGYFPYINGTLHCDLYSSDPASGGSYVAGRSESFTVYNYAEYCTFSFSGINVNTLYFDIWYDMSSDVNVQVNANASEAVLEVDRYVPPTYYTISVSGDSGCTVSGGGSIQEGYSTTISATVKPGYTFDGWYEGSSRITTNTSYLVSNVRSNRSFTAKTIQNTYKIIIDPTYWPPGITSVSGAGTNYHYSDTVTVAVNYELGYKFDGWYKDIPHTDKFKSKKSFVIAIDGEFESMSTEEQTAVFAFYLYPNVIAVTEYIVTVLAGDGVDSVSGGGAIPVGETTTINCVLEGEDFIFDEWEVDESQFTTEQEYTFMPTDDITIIAQVKKCMLNVIPIRYVTATSGGGIHPIGRTVTLSATLATSEEEFIDFDGWYLCSGGEPYGDKLSNKITFDYKVPNEVFWQVGAVGRVVPYPFVYIYKDGEWLEWIPYVFKDHEWKQAWQYTNKNDNWMISV